ncbi:MAG: energy transducer TonB [Terriglobales bacterium]
MRRLIVVLLVLFTLEVNAATAQDSEPSRHSRQVIQKIAPVYPDLAKHTHLSGVVRLRATIASNGSVKSIELIGGNPVFVQSAQDAVTKWKYAPAPAETRELIELEFNLPGR